MQGSILTGAVGANKPRFLNLHLGYVSLGARIAPRLPSLTTIYLRMMSARLRVLKLSLSYYICMVLKGGRWNIITSLIFKTQHIQADYQQRQELSSSIHDEPLEAMCRVQS